MIQQQHHHHHHHHHHHDHDHEPSRVVLFPLTLALSPEAEEEYGKHNPQNETVVVPGRYDRPCGPSSRLGSETRRAPLSSKRSKPFRLLKHTFLSVGGPIWRRMKRFFPFLPGFSVVLRERRDFPRQIQGWHFAVLSIWGHSRPNKGRMFDFLMFFLLLVFGCSTGKHRALFSFLGVRAAYSLKDSELR